MAQTAVKKKTISVSVTPEMAEAIAEWQGLMGFSSQRQFCEFMIFLGELCLEMVGGRALTADNFANALYTVGSRFLQATYRGNVNETVEAFKAWQAVKEYTLQRPLSPGRVLVQETSNPPSS